jgi:SNF2 family DNA or RNA helicase
MALLHGTWHSLNRLDGTFFFWGENEAELQRLKGKTVRYRVGDKHPYMSRLKDRRKLLMILYGTADDPDSCSFVETMILLPTADGFPRPSAGWLLQKDECAPGSGVDTSLKPWTITGLGIRPGKAIEFLSSLTESDKKIGDFTIGPDLLYWGRVSRFALGLLAGQHFMPAIADGPGGKAYARWRYVLDDAGRESFAALAGAMPPVSRAVDQKSGDASREGIIDRFLNSAVDDFIRGRAGVPAVKAKNAVASGAWLDSLSTGGEIKAPLPVLKRLKESLRLWSGRTERVNRQAFRTCFALKPPEPGDDNGGGPWGLEYFLQASDDPSLLIPAETIWKESKKTISYLNRKYDHPQERLLEDLGKAVRLFPAMERSLSTSRPTSAQISIREANIFLTEAAPLLQDSGFGVILPDWWRGRSGRSKLGVKLRFKPPGDKKSGKNLFTLESIVEYDWRLSVGDQEISEEEFQRLSRLKEPLVSIGGKWVALNRDDVDRILKAFKSGCAGEMSLAGAMRLNSGMEDFNGLPVNGSAYSGWVAGVMKNLSSGDKISKLPPPDDFVGVLRDYQVKGYSWLSFMKKYGIGTILADDMGLGKTIQLLALLLKDKEDGAAGATLLLCPTSVAGNWLREAEKFAPSLKVHLHHGTGRADQAALEKLARSHDLIVSTYALAYRDEEALKSVRWKMIVLDEAQNIKNPYTKQSRAVKSMSAGHRIAMTGTPVENRLSELWSIMDFLNPGYLGSLDGYRKRFAIPIERYDDSAASETLKNVVRPFILRRVKTDPEIIRDLPDKVEIKEPCNLTKEQATLYEAIVEGMLKNADEAGGIKRRGIVLAALMRLKQVCDHPSLYVGSGAASDRDAGRSGKLKRMTELLDEALSEGDSALIFTQFVEMGEMLKSHLSDVFGEEVLFLHGGISRKARDDMVQRFGEKGGPRIFVVSLKAGGTGLNLTKASHVFHFDRWWNPAVEDQATDRAYRIGQTKNVMVHKFVCSGTLEEKIDALIESKKALSSNVLGTGEDWITGLSTDELRDMLTLRREAIADE